MMEKTAVDHALNDGEDFELCLVVASADAASLTAAPPPPAKVFRVGTINEAPGLRLRGRDGRETVVESKGFDHFRPG